MCGSRRTFAPHWKNVAGARYLSRISSSAGVDSLGPSSNVRAMARRSPAPLYTEGASREDARPRTAYAMIAAEDRSDPAVAQAHVAQAVSPACSFRLLFR